MEVGWRRKRSVEFRGRNGGGTTRDGGRCAGPSPDAAAARFGDAREEASRKEPRRRRRRRHFPRRAVESRGGSTHRGDLLEVVLHARHGCFRRPRAPLEGWAGACLAVPRAGRRLSLSSTPFFRSAGSERRRTMCLYDCMDAQSSKRAQFVTYSYISSSLEIWEMWQNNKLTRTRR